MGSRARTLAATSLEGPWGPIHLAASEQGVAAIELMTSNEAFITGLERRFRGPCAWLPGGQPGDGRRGEGPTRTMDAAAAHLAEASRAIVDALAGDGGGLAALELDLEDRPAWDRAVLTAVRTIPRGQTRSYGEIARQVGSPGAARAVGGAVGRNPIALAIPCHRVIAGDGTLGGYGGGWWGDRERLLDLKANLLADEGLVVRRRPSAPEGGR